MNDTENARWWHWPEYRTPRSILVIDAVLVSAQVVIWGQVLTGIGAAIGATVVNWWECRKGAREAYADYELFRREGLLHDEAMRMVRHLHGKCIPS